MWRLSASSKRSATSSTPDSSAPSPSSSSPSTSTNNVANDALTTAPRKPILSRQTTLSEALRGNPFRPSSGQDVRSTAPAVDPVQLLNDDLRTFANVYPDVKVEVLRELLLRFDGESRLHVCAEELFRHKHEWARGRLLNPPRDPDDTIAKEDFFQNQSYVDTCKRVMYLEFKALSKSTVDAVLAEVNYSYSKARPVLLDLAAKTWRATITSLFRKKKGADEPPSSLLERSRDGVKRLLSSGNAELDEELDILFFKPVRERTQAAWLDADSKLAIDLNQKEAEESGALFECQCCYDDVPFERITTCSADGHAVCVDCVRRTLNEALFGQGWAKSVDTTISTLRCIASTSMGECQGFILHDLLRLVISTDLSGMETWQKFEQRLATEDLNMSNLRLTNCPFCPYAEASETHAASNKSHKIRWHIRLNVQQRPASTFVLTTLLLFVAFEFLLPTMLLFATVAYHVSPAYFASPKQLFHASLARQYARSLNSVNKMFRCRNPRCGRKSCKTCHKQWRDPHTCHEPLILSLRTTVEAARTAALKRTCPRCGTSFVKSSGCNKLVCVCGYAMCYICRKNIGKVPGRLAGGAGAGVLPLAPGPNGVNRHRAADGLDGLNEQCHRDEDADLIAAGEGYRHFCPHFRPLPGSKCTECDKCDLYKNEDEDTIVRRAGEEAERQWRKRYIADRRQRRTYNNSQQSDNKTVAVATTGLFDPAFPGTSAHKKDEDTVGGAGHGFDEGDDADDMDVSADLNDIVDAASHGHTHTTNGHHHHQQQLLQTIPRQFFRFIQAVQEGEIRLNLKALTDYLVDRFIVVEI